jgi:DNA-binding ferritin-like protein (Dps family)
MAWYEKIIGPLEDKKRYREYRARLKALPESYQRAGRAIERYVLNLGPTSDSERMLQMLDDLVDLLEQHAAAGTPMRDVVGADPVAFAEEFMSNYGDGSWIGKERARLVQSIDDAEQQAD